MVERHHCPEPADQPPTRDPQGGPGQPGGTPFHPAVRYERSDVNFRWIVGCIVAFSILVVVIYFAVWRFFVSYGSYQAEVRRSHYPLAGSISQALPAEPRLEQINRLAEIEKPNVFIREASKEAILQSYGTTDNDGFVHIPIDQAMDVFAQQESRRKASVTAEQNRRQNGLVDGGAPNSGRMFRGRAP